MRRTHRIAGAVLAAGLALAGCSSGTGSADHVDYAEVHHGRDDAGAVDMDVPDPDSAADAQAPESAADGQVPAQDRGIAQAREVITTAEVSMVVADPADGATDVVDLVEAAGGRVDQRTVRAEHTSTDSAPGTGSTGSTTNDSSDPASANLTVRIPAADLEDFLVDLEQVGEVDEVSQTSEDVTQIAQDLDARIDSLQTSTDRLLEIMAEAADTEDLIAIEEALSQRQAELESLSSQRTYLSDQVALSTVHLRLTAERDPVIETDGFAGGLQTGWHALITFVSGLLVFTGMLLPWLAVLAIPAVLIVWAVRRRRRRRQATPPPAMTYAGQTHAGAAPSAGQPDTAPMPPTGQSAAPGGPPSTGPAPSTGQPPSSADHGPAGERGTGRPQEGDTT